MTVLDGEIFANAPLALVAAEVRYPTVSDRPFGMAVHRQLRDALGPEWVIQNDTEQHFEAGVGPDGPKATVRSESVGRITSRQRTKIITVRPESFVIEVADYLMFADFRDLVARVASAVEQVLRPDGISRVGLRYIDEVSVPEAPPQWENWLHPTLMAPNLPAGGAVSQWTGAVQYQLNSDRLLVFRYGPVAGPVVSPTGPLRRPRVPSGPIFMLDFDSSWQPEDIPEFRSDKIVGAIEQLREPVRGLFESVLLPAVIEVFRTVHHEDS